MAVSVSRDLSVQVLEDQNAAKLTDRQQVLRAAIQRGEPKCLGVSQVMLGLMVMSYSIPLHYDVEFTEVVALGVPWWSGLMFITAGAIAILLDKHCTIKILQVCLMVSMVSIVLSVVAVIIYSVDMSKDTEESCAIRFHPKCGEKEIVWRLGRGLKTSLLVFTLAQAVIAAVLCFLLFRQRRSFLPYASLTQTVPPTPTPALN